MQPPSEDAYANENEYENESAVESMVRLLPKGARFLNNVWGICTTFAASSQMNLADLCHVVTELILDLRREDEPFDIEHMLKYDPYLDAMGFARDSSCRNNFYASLYRLIF